MYYLGVDGGGTKTKAVIVDEHGVVVGEGMSGGSNYHNSDLETMKQHIVKAIEEAREGREIEKFERMVLGIAGLDTRLDYEIVGEYLRNGGLEWFRTKELFVVNDAYVGLKSYSGEDYGICVISGTGSVCYGVNEIGHVAKAGDWGYLVGDQGSGFALGKQLLELVVKEFDGRLERSRLTDKVLSRWEVGSVEELIADIYNHDKVPVSKISGVARLLGDEEVMELESVQLLLDNSIRELGWAYEAVVRQLGWVGNSGFSVVLIGGMFHLEGFRGRFVDEVMKRTPEVEIISDIGKSAIGAAELAKNPPEVWPENVIQVGDRS